MRACSGGCIGLTLAPGEALAQTDDIADSKAKAHVGNFCQMSADVNAWSENTSAYVIA